MTISEQIRKAALGPAPDDQALMAAWWEGDGSFGSEGLKAAYGFINRLEDWWSGSVSEDHRRTFLLLVAEALS